MSVDLEALINQSKERLSKHKQYLEQTSQRSGGATAAPQTFNPSHEDEHEFSPLRSNNNNNNNNYNSNNINMSGNSSSNNNNNNNNNPQFYNASAARQHQENQQKQQQQQQQKYTPYASNIAKAGHNNYGEPYENLSASRNNNNNNNIQNNSSNNQSRANVNASSSGHYLSTRTPTKVYDRGQKFIEGRETFLERQRQDAWEKEMKGCTFSPFISRKAASMRSSGGNGGTSPSPERPRSAGQQQQHQKSAKKKTASSSKADDELENQQFLDWCVNSDKANVGFHVDAPSVFLHIQRQQDARKSKADGQSKLSVDTSNWKPTTTVVQEFNFGRSDQPIRSLRKPMLQMVRLDTGASRSGSEGGGGAAGRKSKSPAATSTAAGRKSKSPQQQKRPKTGYARDGDSEDEDNEAEAQRIEKMKSLEKSQRAHQQQIQQQNDEIQKLSGMLASMRMEAEAAKAKVREMTLAQTQQ